MAEAGVEAHLHHLCWVQLGQEGVGHPWSADGLMEEVGVEGFGRALAALKMRASEEVLGVLVAVVGVDLPLGCVLEAEVAGLHGVEEAGGIQLHVVVGQGWEAGGQSDLVGVEGSEQRDWSLAERGEAPVCQVEAAVVVHQLSPPF